MQLRVNDTFNVESKGHEWMAQIAGAERYTDLPLAKAIEHFILLEKELKLIIVLDGLEYTITNKPPLTPYQQGRVDHAVELGLTRIDLSFQPGDKAKTTCSKDGMGIHIDSGAEGHVVTVYGDSYKVKFQYGPITLYSEYACEELVYVVNRDMDNREAI